MAEHTKGPWTHVWTSDGIEILPPDDNEDFNDLPVALVYENAPDSDEVEANARLIAKAPELLEACNSLAALAYSLMAPARLPQCYHDAMRIIAEVEGN